VDDAIFVGRGAGVAERLARRCDSIVCGNEYLAAQFREWNEHVTVVPTAVDTARFVPAEHNRAPTTRRIGWIGTSSNFKYLYDIEDAIVDLLALRRGVVLRVIADCAPRFSRLHGGRVEFVPWSPGNEVREIQSMTVGIMPLADGAWERGKCSYKMLQYMACGVPVVVSPVGMNVDVLAYGRAGLPATTRDDWAAALLTLLDDPVARSTMGHTGRHIAETYFSIQAVAPRLAESLTLTVNAPAAKTRRSSRSDAAAP
jgi:glycosyltransferase involved in cell wall biosynthesis